VGTVIQDMPHINRVRQPRWDRFERADLFELYRALRTQGLSERQAAKELKVPSTTLQAWRLWHDSLDSCSQVAQCFQSGPGLAFFHRLVLAFHVVCVDVGACGMRFVCLFLHLTGRDRFVAASYGAHQPVNRRVAAAIVVYYQDETARLAKDMPRTDLTVTQDETFPGGLCLITMDPESNFILLEQLTQARDQASWNAWMAPALAQLNCQVMQSTSDEAPGLLAYGVATKIFIPAGGVVRDRISSYPEDINPSAFGRCRDAPSSSPPALVGRNRPEYIRVADFVPDSHPMRLWADTFPWDDLVAAIEHSFDRRFPKKSAAGRPGVQVRVGLALELLTHELTCSDEAICDRLRTDWAVMDACGICEVHADRDQVHVVCPETPSTFRARLDGALMDEWVAIQSAAAMETGLVSPAPVLIDTLPAEQGRQRVTDAPTLSKAQKKASR
jgi:hypothetical protein